MLRRKGWPTDFCARPLLGERHVMTRRMIAALFVVLLPVPGTALADVKPGPRPKGDESIPQYDLHVRVLPGHRPPEVEGAGGVRGVPGGREERSLTLAESRRGLQVDLVTPKESAGPVSL